MAKSKKLKRAGALIAGAAMLLTCMLPASLTSAATGGSVNVSIDTSAERTAISPYIYGGNWEFNNARLTAKRFGGNRTTGYNWENNYSNAGSDWQQSSDTYLLSNNNIPAERWSEPGVVTTNFQDQNIRAGEKYSLVTLQAAGYVAADGNGAVAESEKAPSARWKEVKFEKGSPFSLTPDTTDNYVYMDEYVNFLVNKYGNSSTAAGIKGYAVDNEPALWTNTHPRIHPEKPLCSEIVDKNIRLARAVKKVDPGAEIFGLVAYGFAEYLSFQDAPDWSTSKGDYNWFLDYYLDNTKKASDAEGKRLIDVLDLHWYPEAQGGGQRICFGSDSTNIACNKARLQAPRTLWDPTYTEDSWIAQSFKDKLPLLPKVKSSIDKYNPGTKLAITEYSYGGDDHITGGIAEADVLGIFGKYGMYFASLWGGGAYTAAGVNIYTNYDGNGSQYGSTSVKAQTSDIENSSVYASIEGTDDSKLHIIMINKDYDKPMTVNFNLAGGKSYKTGRVFAFDRGGANIYEKASIDSISSNSFSYTVPALTVCHIILDSNSTPLIYGDYNNDGLTDAIDYAKLKQYLMDPNHGYIKCFDLNLDNTVDSVDFALMKMYLLGAIAKLPVESENKPPVASFTASPTEALTGDNINLDASASSDPDGKVSTYAWDFGDGTEGTGAKTIHKYKTAGTYSIKLTAFDDKGLSDSITKTVSISTATGDNSDINFEDGEINGFYSTSSTTSAISVTSDKAFLGSHSLKWDVTASPNGLVDIKKDSNKPVLLPGTTMTFRLWVPEGAPISSLQPYIMPHNSTWSTSEWNSSWKGADSIKKGQWNEISVTLPSTTNTDLTEQQFGIQVQTSGEGNFTMYVDSIDW